MENDSRKEKNKAEVTGIPAANSMDDKLAQNSTSETGTGKKKKKHSSALVAASKARSAVDSVKTHASSDVRGTSGLTNTGPFVSYENNE